MALPTLPRARARRLTRAGISVALAAASLVSVGIGRAAAARADVSPVGVSPVLPPQAAVVGSTDTSTLLQLSVVLQPSDPQGLALTAESVATPGSPDYRRYLSAGQFAARFGPRPSTVKAVTAALTALGLHPGPASANNLVIPVTTTAGKAAKAFGVQLHDVRLAGGRVTYANVAAPRLPATVAPAVASIVGLDNLAPPRPLVALPGAAPAPRAAGNSAAQDTAAAAVTTTGPQPCTAASTAATQLGGYTANQIAAAYNINGLYAGGDLGAGQTVAVYELASYLVSDVATFKSCYGATGAVTNIAVDGGPTSASGAIEAELDIEGVIAAAPSAAIRVYLGPNTESGAIDTYNRIVNDDLAKVVTTSWGDCEAFSGSSLQPENVLFQQAALQGQTVVASSGDNGSEDCQPDNGSTVLAVDDPSSQPFVTGIGGTRLSAIGPPPSEVVWNDKATGDGATGGGISTAWSMPAYQHGPGVSNSFSNGHREVPDVAASSDPEAGYMIFYTGTEAGITGWFPIGGTSAAAPLWAGMVAVMNQGCGCGLGFLNPALYNVAASSFHDITVGNNDLANHGGTYPATAGYDMATGLGSPDATTLAANLTQTEAAFTYPLPGQTHVDTTKPFTWTTVPQAQGYDLAVGTTPSGDDLIESGVLPPTQSSFVDGGLPSGQIVYATLFTEVNGAFSRFQSISFTAAPPPSSGWSIVHRFTRPLSSTG